MKETLRQTIARLAADNLALREQNSVLTTELSFLNAKLTDADIRARRLIASGNRARSAGIPGRREAMEAARLAAARSGVATKVGG